MESVRLPDPMIGHVETEPRRFYDGGLPASGAQPGVPPDPSQDPTILLERRALEGEQQFAMLRRIAYRDRNFGELLVPADTATFRTDLTSVPTLFTWLVPKVGAYLPAALLHDGLTFGEHETPTYTSTLGHNLDQVEADQVFRDAMADTGTGVVRRWLVWSAVTTFTMLRGQRTPWSSATTWGYRVVIGLSLLVVVALGVLATLDLFDVPHTPTLPWMGHRPWWAELIGGLAGAIAIPVVLGLAWGRFRVAGWVMGIGLAVLLHVTVALLVLTGLYQITEKLTDRFEMVVAGLWVLAFVVSLAIVVVLSSMA